MRPGRTSLVWAVPILLFLLVLQVFWRAHTFGTTLVYRPLVELGWAGGGSIEPLDCDEAIYAYMGRRMLEGDVLYRDLSENKPPLGYWLYGLAVAIGGAGEWSIRLMPLPYVLATTFLVWWICRRLGGEIAGLAAAFLFILVDTDPYLFGNGANLEHQMNFFAVASFACLLRGEGRSRGWLLAAGVLLGAATLIKQTAILPGLVYALAVLPGRLELSTTAVEEPDTRDRPVHPLIALLLLAVSFGCAWLLALGVLLIQGALGEGFEHFFTWAMALAREAPPAPGSPSSTIRWLTGNADPNGKLPWPFGNTDYLVWWGTGAWPLWAAFVPAALTSVLSRTSPQRRLVGLWSAACFVEVCLSGLYWQHYYLLAVPGLAMVVGLLLADAFRLLTRGGIVARAWGLVLAALLVSATFWTIRIQVRDYLLVSPPQVTARLKGGGQWIALRQLGLTLKHLLALAKAPPTLYVWGWQSPLYLYGELDSPTRFAFADNLLRAFAGQDHPLVKARVDEIMTDLKTNPPSVIFVADPPYPELKRYLVENYTVSYMSMSPVTPDGRGIWVLRSIFPRFEAARGRPLPGY